MCRLASVAAILLLTSGATASAQIRTTFDVGAGLVGGKGTGAGAAAQVAFELRSTRLPLGLRFDGSHHQWHDGFLTGSAGYRASAVTANLVYRLSTKHVRPYALGGIGGYALQGEGANVGWNVGGGVELQRGRYRFFGEARGHFVSSPARQRLTPLVIGLRF